MNHYCANKDINKLIGTLVREGAVFFAGKKHSKLRLVSGQTLVVPKSPSDYRAILNIKRDVRRGEQEAR